MVEGLKEVDVHTGDLDSYRVINVAVRSCQKCQDTYYIRGSADLIGTCKSVNVHTTDLKFLYGTSKISSFGK